MLIEKLNLLEFNTERVFFINLDELSARILGVVGKDEDSLNIVSKDHNALEADKKWVYIDEVQKNPKLLEIVQKHIKKVKFALSGSSARKLKRGAANLLAGRATQYYLFPLTYKELTDTFNIDDVLRWGTLPEIFEILEDTLLGFFLWPLQSSIRKKITQSPKFYLFDLGVKRALSNKINTQLFPSTEEYGRAFEHFFILECYRLNSYLKTKFEFFYLRTGSGVEIDLIIEKPNKEKIYIEIKSTQHVIVDHVSSIVALLMILAKTINLSVCLMISHVKIFQVLVVFLERVFGRVVFCPRSLVVAILLDKDLLCC